VNLGPRRSVLRNNDPNVQNAPTGSTPHRVHVSGPDGFGTGRAVPPARALAAKPAERAQQAAEVQKLLTDLHKSSLTAEQRKQIVDRLLDLGEEGPRRLAQQCERDYATRYQAYLGHLEGGSTSALRAGWKGKGDIESQVNEARKAVLDVTHSANLTKEMIEQKADPARAKLEALLSISPRAVRDAQPALKQERQDLFDVASAWRRAAEKAPDKAPAENHKSSSAASAPPAAEALEKDLSAKEELAAMMATPMTDKDRQVLLDNVAVAKGLDPSEAKGILILNLLRVRLGIGALAIDPKLCDAARGHCKDMKEKNFFSHESPVPGKKTPWDRAKLAGASAGAENIYTGSKKPEDAIEGWWHSPGHHKNMLGNDRRAGLGRFDTLWTMMLG
jgi:uncharacterized protein YkwD